MKLTHEEMCVIAERGTDEERALLWQYMNEPYYSFQPRPDCPEEFDQQASFVNDRFDGIACCVAGNASGKSYSAAFKAAHFLRTTPPPTNLCKYFIASQTLAMCGALWQEKLSKFITPDLIEYISYWNSAENHPKTVVMKPAENGNRWVLSFRSYEQGRKSFQAISECAGFLCDEQLPNLNLLNEIDTRTREFHYPGSKIYVLTPLEPDEELQERFENPADHKLWRFYRQNAERNFEAGGLASLQWLDNTPMDMRETRRIGDFAHFQGAIFKELNRSVHIIRPRFFSRHAVRFNSIDWGFGHDTAAIQFVEDEGVLYAVAEWGAPGKMISEKVEAIRRELPGAQHTWGDSEDAQQMQEFRNLGFEMRRAKKDIHRGIEIIRVKLSQRKLFIFDTCKKLISQCFNYRWKPDPEKGEKLLKEAPLKRNDDYVDAFRYGVYSNEKSDLTEWERAKIDFAQRRRV